MNHYREQQPVMLDDPKNGAADTQEAPVDGAALTGEPEAAE